MPWFYYSGNVSRPIPVKYGLAVSVKPHSKVEIFEPTMLEIQKMIKKGLLRPTGKPRNAKTIGDVVDANAIREVTPKSSMAKSIAEKGVTSQKGLAPKKMVGTPEMTEGEQNPDKIFVNKDVLENLAGKTGKTGKSSKSVKSKKTKNVEVLSTDESSPDEEIGKEESEKKGKKAKQ